MRRKLTIEERDKRNDARWKIIQLANNHKMSYHAYNLYIPKLFGMKNLQQAVYLCRQNMLASGKLLMEAGFTPRAARPGVPMVIKKLIKGER